MGIRVAVVDDQPIFRAGLCDVIRNSDRLDLVGHGDCHDDALSIAKRDKPELLLLDAEMPGSVIETLRRVTEITGQMRTILMSSQPKNGVVTDAMRAGARGFVLRHVKDWQLVDILQSVYRGQLYMEPSLASSLLTDEHAKADTPVDWARSLTARELDVLRHVSDGLTNKEIALRYELSEKTIKHHMTRILHKLHARNRVEAALIAKKRFGWD